MEKTEDQIAREKAAVAAMKNAQANMQAAFDRISTLERGLASAVSALRRAKTFTPSLAYVSGGQKTIHADIDGAIGDAIALLPA